MRSGGERRHSHRTAPGVPAPWSRTVLSGRFEILRRFPAVPNWEAVCSQESSGRVPGARGSNFLSAKGRCDGEIRRSHDRYWAGLSLPQGRRAQQRRNLTVCSGRRSRWQRRQRNTESRTATGFALDSDTTVQPLNGGFGSAQPEARASVGPRPGGLDPIESLENAVPMLSRNARTLVHYFDRYPTAFTGCDQAHHACRRAVPDRVIQEVDNGMQKQSHVCRRFQISRTFQIQADPFFLGLQDGDAVPELPRDADGGPPCAAGWAIRRFQASQSDDRCVHTLRLL